jgi:DNA-directed RNA polymerase subunit alpha
MARRVLAINPNHARAQMMAKDAASSKNMYYDEEQAKRQAYRSAILDTPVTDFELSVRARNCLKKMDIRTLGDLVATTEASLMSYKNFGETSLKEIKEMLSAKGLSLGQASETELTFGGSSPVVVSVAPGATDGATDGVSVAQVEFSIRVRRALETLGIRTLGDLAAKSEAELMSCPNFGQTSVNEVHAKLAEHGLRMAES